MGIAKTVISVAIIGDAKKLIGALGKADAATGGLISSASKLLVGFQVVDKSFEFIQGALTEADRLGDALTRLGTTLPPEFVSRLTDTADEFVKIGASRQDILELEAIFADAERTIGLTNDQITNFAQSAAATAVALSLIDDQGRDANTIMDLITKAAGGSAKAAKELGVSLLSGVDPATQLSNILFQLKPRLDDATQGTGDLERNQKELQARVEDLQAELGTRLTPALIDVFTWLNNIAAHDWAQDIGEIQTGFENLLSPLARVRDVLANIVGLLNETKSVGKNTGIGTFGGTLVGGSNSDSGEKQSQDRNNDRNGIVRDRIGGP